MIAFASNDTGEGTVAPATMTFTAATWSTPQSITLTGVDDSEPDGDQTWTVLVTVAGAAADPLYAALDPADLDVVNLDDDPAALELVTQPASTPAFQPITPPVTVRVVDAEGRAVPGLVVDVTVEIGANPGGGTLDGILTVTSDGTVATFAGLSIDRPASGYTLIARSPGLVEATSEPFDVEAVRTFSGPSSTGSGTVTASFLGGGATCTFASAALVPLSSVPLSPPAEFPHGLLEFVLEGCTAPVTMTIEYPSPLPAGTVYWKCGPTSRGGEDRWYVFSDRTAASTSVFTLHLLDGALGDDDWLENGRIVDQGGPGLPSPIPALSPAGVAALVLLLALAAVAALRRIG